MNDFDLMYLFLYSMEISVTFFVSYLSSTSAFLAVTYTVGKKLPPFFAKLVITLYSLASVFFLVAFQRNWAQVIAIRGEMANGNLSWVPAVTEPHMALHIVMWIGVIVMSLLYAGSIWYILSVRRGSDEKNT